MWDVWNAAGGKGTLWWRYHFPWFYLTRNCKQRHQSVAFLIPWVLCATRNSNFAMIATECNLSILAKWSGLCTQSNGNLTLGALKTLDAKSLHTWKSDRCGSDTKTKVILASYYNVWNVSLFVCEFPLSAEQPQVTHTYSSYILSPWRLLTTSYIWMSVT